MLSDLDLNSNRITNLGAPINANDAARLGDVSSTTIAGIINVTLSPYNAVGDGVVDDTTAIQAAIDSGKIYAQYTGGAVEIYIPAGIYKTTATLDLSNCHGLHIRGAGFQGTEIVSSGNYPVFTLTGTALVNLQSVSITDMLIHNFGKTHTSAHGIQATFTNVCLYQNLRFFGCYNALDLTNVWQNIAHNCLIQGQSSLQNNTGIWLHATGVSNPNNALIASNVYIEYTNSYGIRIENGQGSKFVNCEVGGAGNHGIYVGDPTTGTYKCEFINFDNVLSDSCSGRGWLFKLGSATALQFIQLTNCWSGNHSGYGFWVEGANNFIMTGTQSHGNGDGGINFLNSTECVVAGAVMNGNNIANGATSDDVLLNGTTYTTISAVKSDMANSTSKSLKEYNSSDNNIVSGCNLFQGFTLAGASSSVSGVNAANGVAAEWRAVGDQTIAVVAGTGNTAYLGLGTTSNRLLHCINRGPSGDISIFTNGGQRFRAGNGSGATGFFNENYMPVKLPEYTVTGLPSFTSSQKNLHAFATNGRKVGESAAAGTGVPCYWDGASTTWKRYADDTTVVA